MIGSAFDSQHGLAPDSASHFVSSGDGVPASWSTWWRAARRRWRCPSPSSRSDHAIVGIVDAVEPLAGGGGP
jgi:hypothetical protein